MAAQKIGPREMALRQMREQKAEHVATKPKGKVAGLRNLRVKIAASNKRRRGKR